MADTTLKIIDSHIHLYAKSHLTRLNWTAGLPSDHILNRQNSVNEYKAAINEDSRVLGFVFVETDRKSTLDAAGWKDSLEEVSFLTRIAQGRPVQEEGHEPVDSRLVLGIVPWAPIPAGLASMAEYVSKVRDACGDEKTRSLVKGFRYLLQDKPAETMLQSEFIAALRWLGDHDFSFDLGVDARQGGITQLEEAGVMLRQVYVGGNELRVIINHVCKPNLRLTASDVERIDESEDFVAWAKCIQTLAGWPKTYMKLSGFFSELLPQDENSPIPILQLVEQVRPWVTVAVQAFGPRRVIFGSDWPVCSAGGPGSKSWRHWVDLVTAVLEDQGLTMEEKQWVWSKTAMEAYRIAISES